MSCQDKGMVSQDTFPTDAPDEPTIEHLRNALQLLDLGDVAGARRRIERGIAALPVTPGAETPGVVRTLATDLQEDR